MSWRISTILGVAAILSTVIFSWFVLCHVDDDNPSGTTQFAPLSDLLQHNPDQLFESATEVIDFTFPRDHGPHPSFRTEWWYFTGTLSSQTNHLYGYQFTIFRRALTAEQSNLDSNWAGGQVYLAHIGITNVQKNEYLIDEIYSRDALGLAGAKSQPFKVWVENWTVWGMMA